MVQNILSEGFAVCGALGLREAVVRITLASQQAKRQHLASSSASLPGSPLNEALSPD